MTEQLELVMYSRTMPCPYVTIARRTLQKLGVPYRELMIDEDDTYRARVLAWTGFLSVPTLIIARQGQDLPISEPTPLPKGASPRGVDRGPMLTEASEDELTAWLRKHGFLP
ncbi:MAG: hypothetical protein OHK0023_25040 [Anaerolineae bacterium]